MKPVIVIPAYNEGDTVARVVEQARGSAPVIVVDDGSTDETASAAANAGAEVVSHRRRLGKGQAIRTGIAAARARGASVMITLDADGQHDPADIPAVLDAILTSPHAIVIASRRSDEAALPRGRRNALRMAGFFVAWTGDVTVRDTQSGFRAYPLPLFDELTLRRGGFVFETEVLLAASAAGWPIVEIDVTAIPRARRKSRFRPVVDGGAIVAYLGQRVAMRWVQEAQAAVREVVSVVSRDRRRARHASMLESAAPYADSPGSWALAIGVAAARHAVDRVTGWWCHPRRRRATLAAGATAVAPIVLGAATLECVAGRWLPDLVSPLVDAFFSSHALARIPSTGGERAERSSSLAIADEPLSADPVSQT